MCQHKIVAGTGMFFAEITAVFQRFLLPRVSPNNHFQGILAIQDH
jgi:hypothetical protein